MENLTVKEVTLKAVSGSDVYDCIKDAMIYSIKHPGTKVWMSHNGIKIEIKLGVIMDKYHIEWDNKLKKASNKKP